MAVLCALIIQAASSLTPAADPAWRPQLVRLDGYSRNISMAVAVEPRAGGVEIWSGAGGDVFLLERAAGKDSKLALARDDWPYTWSTSGVVLDLALAPDFAYVAAFRDGVRAFDRADPGREATSSPGRPGEQALSIAWCELGPRRFVALGSEGYGAERGGGVALYEHLRERRELRLVSSCELGATYAVALSTRAAAPGAELVLLAGTGCSADGGLVRLDLHVAEDEVRVVRRARWSAPDQGGAPKPTVVRDILLDGQRDVAYVAAFWDGVWAFDLSAEEGLAPLAGKEWPLRVPNSPADGHGCRCEPRFERCAAVAHSLALTGEISPGVRHLLVGYGPPRVDVSCVQFLSDANGYPPCNLSAAPPELHDCPDPASRAPALGVYAYELGHGGASAAPVAARSGAGALGYIGLIPAALAAAGESEGGYDVYTAGAAFGLQVLRFERDGTRWRVSRKRSWSAASPARLAMPAFDDLVLADGERPVLYASTEGSIAAFELSGDHPLSQPRSQGRTPHRRNPTAPWTSKSPGIELARFDGDAPRLVGTSRRGGLVVLDTRDPAKPRDLGPEVDRGGFGYGLVATRGVGARSCERWLLSAQEVRDARPAGGSWSVRLWSFGSDAEPRDPGATAPIELASFATPAGDRRELSGLSTLEHGGARIVYALYGPATDLSGAAPRAGGAGVQALRATVDSGGACELRASGEPVPAFDDATSEHRGVRSTLDPQARRLYAAWVGCLAVYDVSEPTAPRLLARRDLRGVPGAYGLVPAPVQVAVGPALDGRRYAYVALLNDGLWVLDVTDARSFESAPFVRFETPWQTTAVLVDPRDASRTRLFLAEGTRGMEWVELRAPPGPGSLRTGSR